MSLLSLAKNKIWIYLFLRKVGISILQIDASATTKTANWFSTLVKEKGRLDFDKIKALFIFPFDKTKKLMCWNGREKKKKLCTYDYETSRPQKLFSQILTEEGKWVPSISPVSPTKSQSHSHYIFEYSLLVK